MRSTKWLSLKRPSLSGHLSAFFFVAVLPFYLLTFPLYLTMAIFNRLMALFLRERSKKKSTPVSFTRAPSIPSPVSPDEINDLLDPETDAWEYAILRRQKAHLETCLDYSIPDYDDDLR